MLMLDFTLAVTLVCLMSSNNLPICSQKSSSLVLVLRKAEEERLVCGLKLLMVLLCKKDSPVDAILILCVFAVVEGRSLASEEQKAFPLIVNLLIPIKLQPPSRLTHLNHLTNPHSSLISLPINQQEALIIFSPSIILTMTEKQEQFPFEQFITALQQQSNLEIDLANILTQIQAQNIYWIYSSVSTIVEIVKGKEEEPMIKCRALDAARIVVELCEYPVVTLVEVYLLPVLWEIAIFKGRKSEELTSYYFQQTQGIEDSQNIRRLSLEYVQRAIQLIFLTSKLKPYRTVEAEEIKQESAFKTMQASLKLKGIQGPKVYVWTAAHTIKDLRMLFLQRLRKFAEQSQPWVEFLLVNLLQQIRTNKKQLLQLRQMLSYGQGYLTSAMINLCEDQLMDLSQNLQMKRKYLALINEIVRYGDIEAIIMIKNSQFVPSIVAHFSKIQGHLGIQQGENIYPQVKSNKQVKREFYADFLRCLETWAVSMPEDYDSEDFTLKQLYKLLKDDRKLKFPENIHMNRYQKELQENLIKNKERNDKLIELLENVQDSKQSQQSPVSKMSNVLQRTILLPPSQLQNRFEQAKKAMKQLLIQGTSEKAFKVLSSFKENWITYLEALDLEAADEGKLQALILSGQKCVEEIQLLTPFYLSYSKGKITFRDFKERMKEVVDLHNEVSANISHNKSKSINLSKSIIAKTKMARSKMGNSKLGGKELMDKIKAKSKFGDSSQMDLSKVIDRSQMLDKSKQMDRSRAQISNMQLKIESKAIFNKAETKAKQQIEPQQQQLSNKLHKIKPKKEEVIELQTPKGKHIQHKNTQIAQTIKKEHQLVKEATQNQRIRRIDDYEVTDLKQKEVQGNVNRLSSSREKGSKILLRRSQNKSSRLERSSESHHSQDRKSVKSNKKIKESSLFIKSPRLTSPSPKNALADDEFLKDRMQINETIEVNGNIIKQGAPTQKRTYKGKQDNSFNNFKDGVESISSIHSNSVLRIFQHNAEKILDMTQQLGSEMKMEKKVRNEVVEHHQNVELPPVVGDYYQETAKKDKNSSPEQTPKKQQKNSFKSQESNEIRKTYFNQKEPEKPSVFKEQVKVKKEEKKQPTKSQAKETHKVNHPPQKIILNKTEKPSKPEKTFQVVQVQQINTEKPQSPKLDIQKDQQIQSLQQKIRELQRETMLMKTKLAAKDNQIRSIKSSSKYGSQRGYPQFTTLSQSHADNSERTSNRGSSLGKTRKTEPTRFQKDIESQYKQYLQRIKGSTFRKSLLKLKCLVHKTDQIEIGCMSQRSDKSLECTLYVTPHRYNLIDFTMALIHDNCIRTKIVPQQIKLIPSKKQQKIHLTIQIIKIPFCLPEIEINYKSDSQYSSNYNRLTLPLCFSKFCEISPLQSQERQEKELQYIRSDTFKLNTKIIKLQKISDCFPNFTILPPNKDREQYLLTASCRYLDSVFNILLNISQKKSWIEGFLKKGELKPMNFLICTFKQILDGSKK